MHSPSSFDSCKVAPSTGEALNCEQDIVNGPEMHDSPKQGASSMLSKAYTAANASSKRSVRVGNAHSLTSTDSSARHDTTLLTWRTLAQHDTMHTAANNERNEQCSSGRTYGLGSDLTYDVGGKDCWSNRHHDLHEHSHESATHAAYSPQADLLGECDDFLPSTGTGRDNHLHPYPMTIYVGEVNDQSRQVNFNQEDCVAVKHMQTLNWNPPSKTLHGIGAQFEFLGM